MKKIGLDQMENITAGGWLSCAGNVAGLAATIIGGAALTTVTAGAGLLFVAGLWAGGIGTGISCGSALAGQ